MMDDNVNDKGHNVIQNPISTAWAKLNINGPNYNLPSSQL